VKFSVLSAFFALSASLAQAIAPVGAPWPQDVIYECKIDDTEIDLITKVNFGFMEGKFWITEAPQGAFPKHGRFFVWHNPWSDFQTTGIMQTRHDFDLVGVGPHRLTVGPDGTAMLIAAEYDEVGGTEFYQWDATCTPGEAY
jgi:hypothetical protein